MKKMYALLLAGIMVINLANAQNPVPNPGFELLNTDSSFTGWEICDNWFDPLTPGYSGNFAAHGTVTAGGSGLLLELGSTFSPTGSAIPTMPYTTNIYLNFYYKFNKVDDDQVRITSTLYRPNLGLPVANIPYNYTLITPSSVWKHLSIPYTVSSTQADMGYLRISFQLSSPTTGASGHAGSSFTLDDVSITTTPSAIEETEKESAFISVFPNPACNKVYISAQTFEGKTAVVQITNMLGQTVKEIQADFTANNLAIDISELSTGNYIVAVKTDEQVQTKRLVVE